ncbi:MAG: hypothetical protein MUF03_03565 [Rubrivivax sp.]|jgi:predicted Zn finger-like uncharacterized protein|nr:hypothetical protein [Rubrivivax sp.]
MKLAEGIRKHGFRKWYERQLLRSHAHLALTFVCLVGVFMGFEHGRGASAAERVDDMFAVLLCGGTGLWALRRYLSLLQHAEHAAHQADCPACGAYARLRLVHPDASGDCTEVRCGRCGHEWQIEI